MGHVLLGSSGDLERIFLNIKHVFHVLGFKPTGEIFLVGGF